MDFDQISQRLEDLSVEEDLPELAELAEALAVLAMDAERDTHTQQDRAFNEILQSIARSGFDLESAMRSLMYSQQRAQYQAQQYFRFSAANSPAAAFVINTGV